MMTYNELKKALAEVKNDTCKEIAAIIIQSKDGITAGQISHQLNGTVTTNEVAGLICNGKVRNEVQGLGYWMESAKVEVGAMYVNASDPSDTIYVSHKKTKYSARPMDTRRGR